MSQQYLSSEIISNLSSLSLKARLLVEGLIVGMHKSPYHGFSVEFSEHRLYNPGDEIRNIDWKIWGKTDKYFVKEYEEETNLLSHIILDQSASMSYSSSNISKLDYAKILAASLAYLMLKQQDGVGLTLFDSKLDHLYLQNQNLIILIHYLKSWKILFLALILILVIFCILVQNQLKKEV